MVSSAQPRQIVGPAPQRAPSPNYAIQWGWNFASGAAKVQAVAYIIRADRRGRITMAGFLPSTASAGALYGFIGRVSGDALTGIQGAAVVQYELDSSADAGTTRITSDLGLGSVLDGILKDPTNTGAIVVTSTSGDLPKVGLALPLTLLMAGGPEPGPLQGKDAILIEAGDYVVLVVYTTSHGSGSFQAEIVARPFIKDQPET
jgi:hypothetical protein